MKRLDSLTGLRFIAALHVVCYHAGVPLLGSRGEASVGLFFALSGFVLTYGCGDLEGGRRRFWRARLARIYPLYLVGLLLTLPIFLGELSGPQLIAAGGMVVVMLQAWLPETALRWNFPGWSLSAEAFFYAIFPAIVPLTRTLSRRTLLGIAMILWIVTEIPEAVVPYGAWWHGLIQYNPLIRLPEFLMGIVAGRVFVLQRSTNFQGLLSVAVAAEILILIWTPVATGRGELALLFAMLVYTLASGQGPLAWALSRPAVVHLGEASYALYILHYPVLYWSSAVAGVDSGPKFLVASILLCLAVAIVAQRFEVFARRWILERV